MRQVIRRGILLLGLALALAPLSAFADGNQDAIDAARAQKAWLEDMTPLQQGVALGQMEISNARAIARLVPWSGHAQAEIPNSMGQYAQFCNMAIQDVAAQVANANAMVQARPWDPHAQAELANATAISRAVWSIIGTSYPGNPYANLAPVQEPTYATDSGMVAGDDATVASDDDTAVASDDSLVGSAGDGVASDDGAIAADDEGVIADQSASD